MTIEVENQENACRTAARIEMHLIHSHSTLNSQSPCAVENGSAMAVVLFHFVYSP